MSFCPSCGIDVGEGAYCPQCGTAMTGQPPAYAQPPVQYIVKPVTPDAPSAGLAWLSFFFPLVGLILYLVYHDSKPMKAASAGKGALWGFLLPLVVLLLFVIVTMGMTLFSAYKYAEMREALAPLEKSAQFLPLWR